MPLDHHPQGITHQYHIHTSRFCQAGKACIIGGYHGNLFGCRFHTVQIANGYLAHVLIIARYMSWNYGGLNPAAWY
jgi:hypothetical protein